MSASGSHIVSSRFRGAAENTLPPVAGAKERRWHEQDFGGPRCSHPHVDHGWETLTISDHQWPLLGYGWMCYFFCWWPRPRKESSNWGCCRIPLLAYMVALAMVLVSRDALKLQNSFLMVSINVVNRMPKTIPKKCMLFFCLGCLLSPNGSCLYRLMALDFPHQTINFWGFVLYAESCWCSQYFSRPCSVSRRTQICKKRRAGHDKLLLWAVVQVVQPNAWQHAWD